MAAEYDKSRPPWSSRLLAVVGYLGFTPLLRLFRVRRDDVYLRQHQAQGLALLVLLLPLLLIWPIFQVLEVMFSDIVSGKTPTTSLRMPE